MSDLKTYRVSVTQEVDVTIDSAKFSPEFMAEFRESFFRFTTVEEHVEHLGQLHARGLAGYGRGEYFVEGYGPLSSMGIVLEEVAGTTETEIVTQ